MMRPFYFDLDRQLERVSHLRTTDRDDVMVELASRQFRSHVTERERLYLLLFFQVVDQEMQSDPLCCEACAFNFGEACERIERAAGMARMCLERADSAGGTILLDSLIDPLQRFSDWERSYRRALRRRQYAFEFDERDALITVTRLVAQHISMVVNQLRRLCMLESVELHYRGDFRLAWPMELYQSPPPAAERVLRPAQRRPPSTPEPRGQPPESE